MNALAFYLAAVIAVAATLLAIAGKNAVQSLLYLAVSLLAVSIIFFGYGAPFIAALEVIVYAGSIIVLFIFVVMMLNLGRRAAQAEEQLLPPHIWIGPAILAALLAVEMIYLASMAAPAAAPAQVAVSPRAVGLALYGPYLLGVELSSMLLLAALVGAYHLGWRRQAFPEVKDGESSSSAAPGGDSLRAGGRRSAGAA